MRKLLITFFALIMFSAVYANENDTLPVFDTITTQEIQADVNQVSPTSNSNDFLDILITVLILGTTMFMSGHMIYTFIKTKRFAKQNYDVEYFKSKRREMGKYEESTDDENDRCISLLDEAFHCWTNVDEKDGEEYRKPKKMKEIKASAKFLDEVIELAPTDPDIIETLNSYKEVVSSNEKREFDGSKIFFALGIVVGIAVFLIQFYGIEEGFGKSLLMASLLFFIPSLIYLMASFTPMFLIEKRMESGSGGWKITSGLVGVALGVLGGGYTVRTVYTDGSHEDDHTGHWLALALGIFLLIFVAATLIFWAFINYLRNYVLFF